MIQECRTPKQQKHRVLEAKANAVKVPAEFPQWSCMSTFEERRTRFCTSSYVHYNSNVKTYNFPLQLSTAPIFQSHTKLQTG